MVSVTNKKTGETTRHHVYRAGDAVKVGRHLRPSLSVRTTADSKNSMNVHNKHNDVLANYLQGKKPVKESTQDMNEKTLTPAEIAKREEIVKAMAKKNPDMNKGKQMAIATSIAKRVAESLKRVDEVSTKTLSSYADKARSDVEKTAGKSTTNQPSKADISHMQKRNKGIRAANLKIGKNVEAARAEKAKVYDAEHGAGAHAKMMAIRKAVTGGQAKPNRYMGDSVEHSDNIIEEGFETSKSSTMGRAPEGTIAAERGIQNHPKSVAFRKHVQAYRDGHMDDDQLGSKFVNTMDHVANATGHSKQYVGKVLAKHHKLD